MNHVLITEHLNHENPKQNVLLDTLSQLSIDKWDEMSPVRTPHQNCDEVLETEFQQFSVSKNLRWDIR
jgi:hypothetical protein